MSARWVRLRWLFAVGLLSLGWLQMPLAIGQDTAGLVNKTVMVIRPEVPLKEKTGQAKWIATYGDFVKVTHVAGDWLWIGKRKGYIQLKDVLSSIPELDAKLAAEPNEAMNYVYRATARNLGEIDQSLAELDKAVSLAPENALAIAVRGNHRSLNKEYPKAIADLTKATKLDPKLLVAQMWLARTLEHQGDLKGAEAAFQTTLQLAPNNGRVIGDWGRYLVDQNRLDEAITTLTTAIEKTPELSTAYLNRCIAHRLQGKFDAALADVNQYAKLEPDSTTAYYERCAVLIGKFDAGGADRKPEDLDQAVADTEALMKLDESASPLKVRGDVLRRQGKAKDSLAAYNAAIEKNPKYAAALYERAVLWYQNGLYENAANDITAVLALQPENLQMHRDRAECLLNIGRYDEALADCETVLAKIPDDVISLRRRGLAYDGLRQYEKAIDDYTAVLETQPQDALALNNRGAAFTHLNQNERAIQDFEQAIAVDPRYVRAHKNLGIAQRNLGKNEKSVATFEAALALHQPPEQPLEEAVLSELYLELAGSQRALGNEAKGLEFYNKAIEANSENFVALNYRAWLQATSPDDSLRNGKQALADATKAAELTKRKVADVLDTLAAAHAETGDFDSAMNTLLEAESLATENKTLRSREIFYANDQPFRQGAEFDYRLEVEEDVAAATAVEGAIGAAHVPSEAFAAISILPEKLLNARLMKQMPPEFEQSFQQDFMSGLVPPQFQQLVKLEDIESVLIAMYPHRSLPPVAIAKFKSLIEPGALAGIEGLAREELGGKEYYTDGRAYLYLADPQTLVFTNKLESLKQLFKTKNGPSRLRNKLLTTKADAPLSGFFFTGVAPRFLGGVLQHAPPQLASLLKRADAISISLQETPTLGATATLQPAKNLSAEELTQLKSDLEAAKNMAAGQAGLLLSQAPLPQASDLAKLVHRTLSEAKIEQTDDTLHMKIDGSELEKQLGKSLPSMLEQLGKASQAAQQVNNFRSIALGLLNYEIVYKALPAQASRDAEGKPLLSWRVLILPYLSPEDAELYKKFKLDEPWDSPHNLPLAGQMPTVYRSPGVEGGKTTALAILSDDSVIGRTDPVQLRQITDGLSNTIALVQVAPEHAVPWTKPADYEYNAAKPKAQLSTTEQTIVAFGDGSVRQLDTQIDVQTLNALFTKSGGEVFDDF